MDRILKRAFSFAINAWQEIILLASMKRPVSAGYKRNAINRHGVPSVSYNRHADSNQCADKDENTNTPGTRTKNLGRVRPHSAKAFLGSRSAASKLHSGTREYRTRVIPSGGGSHPSSARPGSARVKQRPTSATFVQTRPTSAASYDAINASRTEGSTHYDPLFTGSLKKRPASGENG